jgi:nitrate reductase gamma subunit
MDIYTALEFARGPMFYFALLVCIAGLSYRVVRVLLLGWKRDRVPGKGSKFGGVAVSFLKGLVIWPFIPWVKNTFTRNPVIYLAGGLFHLSLFVVILLGTTHMLVWKSLLGFGWPTFPLPIVDGLAAAGLAAMVALAINRATHPVLRLISGAAEWFNLILVFLPMITGYLLTHHLYPSYEAGFLVHMLTVNLLLIWIPFSRIAHFVFYFFSRTIHGAQFGKRSATP